MSRFGAMYFNDGEAASAGRGATNDVNVGPMGDQPYGPVYRPDLMVSAGDPSMSDQPYGPVYDPVQLFLEQYKWWLVGGGVGLFLLAGGSILGISLKKRRRSRR